MGVELMAAIIGPLFGGTMSLMIWISKKNTERIDTGFSKLTTCVNVIERKVDYLQLEMIKNYATRDQVVSEIHDLKREMKEALDESKQRGERLYNEISDVRKLYWDTRDRIYNHDERDDDKGRS